MTNNKQDDCPTAGIAGWREGTCDGGVAQHWVRSQLWTALHALRHPRVRTRSSLGRECLSPHLTSKRPRRVFGGRRRLPLVGEAYTCLDSRHLKQLSKRRGAGVHTLPEGLWAGHVALGDSVSPVCSVLT